MVTLAVMVDIITKLLPTLETSELLHKLFILILLRLKPANSKEDNSKYQILKLLWDAAKSKTP
jgi:hypothetical protein